MRLYIRFSIFILLALLSSCTDVVDVTVQEGPTRLVVEASLDWEKGTQGNIQTIKLSESTSFFDTNTQTAVTNANVVVTNDSNGASFVFAHQANGEYLTTIFEPIIGQSYTLQITYNGESFSATETLTSVTEITDIFQDREDGFEDDILEVHINFTDPLDEENNYLFKFQRRGDLLPELEETDDEFVNGNEIDWWYEIEENEDENILPFQAGDIVDIEMYGVSRAYYNYIDILIDQIGGVGFFEATPVAVKGNCINTTNPDNYAFGYFRLTEVVKTSYTFVEDN